MRKFKLINAVGEEFDLMRKDAFFHAPDGLGFSFSNTYEKTGSEFIMVEEIESQKGPSGEMVFASYEQYAEFTLFISKRPLKFLYMPLNRWAYLDVTVTNFQKSEMSQNGFLICPIDFTASGRWYVPFTYEKKEHIGQGKKYSYDYDYTYAEMADGIFDIDNKGTSESRTTLTIFGPIENPAWSLAVNNATVLSGKVTASIIAGHKLVVCSKESEMRIMEYDVETGAVIQNLCQMQDWAKENFITVPSGTSTLRVTGEGAERVRAALEVYETYDTV